MKHLVLASAAVVLLAAMPDSARADCAAAPIGSTSDMVISFLSANGTQIAPSTQMASSVKDGMMVYDSAAKLVKICDGTNWKSFQFSSSSGSAAGAANEVQFRDTTTGNLAANPGFVWDNVNGWLGIGTASPSGRLDVVSQTATRTLFNLYTLDLNTDSVAGSWARAFRVTYLKGSTDGQDGGAFGVYGIGATPNYVYMAIPTADLTGYDSSKIVALTNAGYVGIGTTAPQAKLDVNGGVRHGADAICSVAKAGMLAWNSNTLQLCDNTGAWVGIASSSGLVGASSALSAITAASAANTIASGDYAQTWNWTLTSVAKSGITFGETAAATNGVGVQSVVKVNTLASSTAVPLMVTNLGNGASFRVNDETGDADATPFIIDASGNVGIGTAAPTEALHVAGNMRVSVGDVTMSTGRGMTWDSGTEYIKRTSGIDHISIATQGVDRIIAYNTGTVGIGTTTATASLSKLQVVGGVQLGTDVTCSAAKAGMLAWNSNTLQLCDNTGAWVNIASSSGVGATDRIVSGTASLVISANAPKLTMGGHQVMYNADATYTGALFVGNGGASLSHASGDEGYFNVALGKGALFSITAGSYNTASGVNTLYSNTTGSGNTASGVNALYSNDTGGNNTASGVQALFHNTSGSSNTAYGVSALYTNTTGANNTASGMNALVYNTTGYNNTTSGFESLFSNTTGYNNTSGGMYSMHSNTSGFNNIAIGASALYSNTTGGWNTASGVNALFANTTGSSNTALGGDAGHYIADGSTANATGDSGVFLGAGTRALADGDSNEIVIGTNAIGNGSNSVTLGNAGIAKTILRGNVGIGTSTPQALLDVAGGVKTGADATCSVAKAGMLAWNSNTLQLCDNTGAWVGIASSSGLVGASSALSAITAATAANTIASGDNAQTWNWALTTAGKSGVTFGESAAATNGVGVQSVVKVNTLAASTAVPLMVTNLGAGASFRVNDETGDADSSPFIIDASGNVGIGTATPDVAYKLDVAGASAMTKLHIKTATGLPAPVNGSGVWMTDGTNVWRTGGKIGLGMTTAPSVTLDFRTRGSTTQNILRLQSEYDDYLTFENYRNDQWGPVVFATKARGSFTTPAAVQADDSLLALTVQGYDGSGVRAASQILFDADAAPTAGTAVPGRIRFVTANSSGTMTERMRIDRNGQVGIGTTAPAYQFDLNGGAASINARITGSNHDSAVIRFENTSASGGRTYHVGSTDSASGGGNGFSIYDVTALAPRFLINPSGNVGIGTTTPMGIIDVAGAFYWGAGNDLVIRKQDNADEGGELRLSAPTNASGTDIALDNFQGRFRVITTSPSSAERFAVLQNGNVGIGTATPQFALDVVPAAVAGGIRIKGDDTSLWFDDTANGSTISYRWHSNVDAMFLHSYSGGTPTHTWTFGQDGQAYKDGGGSWAATSDRRLKTNIQPIVGALGKIDLLQPVSFEWKNPAEHAGVVKTGGFIAQDVQKVFPSFVTKTAAQGQDKALVDADGREYAITLPIEFDGYVVAAIKELKAENDGLKSENTALKAQMEAMNKRLEALEARQ